MTRDSNHVVAEFLELFAWHGDLAKVDAVVAETFVDHHPWEGHPGTLEGFKAGLVEFRGAFPDARCSVDAVETEGDHVSVLATRTGTHLGPLMGAMPTGRRIRIQVLEILRLERRRIVERWGFLERDTLRRQLGLVA